MNNIYFIVGVSGSWKSTIESGFLEKYAKNYWNFEHIVSYATRKKRPWEIDGKDYYFISNEEFSEMDKNHEFIQKIEHAWSKKGTTVSEWKDKLSKGHVILPMLLDSIFQLKKKLPDVIPWIENHMYIIFIDISEREVYKRLVNRFATEKGFSYDRFAEMYFEYNQWMFISDDPELITMFVEINERLEDIELLKEARNYADYILNVDGKTPEQAIEEFNNIIADTFKK